MAVEFAPPGARPFNANPSTEQLEVSDVTAMPCLIGGLVDGRVNEPIVQIHCMVKGPGPKLCRKPRSIEQGSDFDGKGIVVYFRAAILGGTIGPRWFYHITKLV